LDDRVYALLRDKALRGVEGAVVFFRPEQTEEHCVAAHDARVARGLRDVLFQRACVRLRAAGLERKLRGKQRFGLRFIDRRKAIHAQTQRERGNDESHDANDRRDA
jgi:hypothetical protein